MIAPERRTRADLIVAATIVLVLMVAASVIWLRSDARGTTSVTADTPLALPASALSVPESLTERWRAPDPAPGPVTAVGGAIVVGGENSVRGLNPVDGVEAWSYVRDRPLCAMVGAWDAAVAAFSDPRGCGQVTELDGSTGERRDQRTNDADPSVTLTFDGTYVTQAGPTRLEVWRSDLVRTIEYGRVAAPVSSGDQPRSGCTLLSTGSSSARLAVLEQCPDEDGPRLTAQNPVPEDNTEPEINGSTVLTDVPVGGGGARVLAVVGDRIGLYLPPSGTNPARVAVFDGSSEFASAQALDEPAAPTAGPADVTRTGTVLSWWTGGSTIGFTQIDLAQRWVLPDTLGPGAVMAGQLLVPISDGLAVVDIGNGVVTRTIAVDRGGYDGPVTLAVLGTGVVEKRGDEVVSLQ